MIGVLVLGVVAAAFVLLLRNQQKEIAALLGIATAVFLFLHTLEGMAKAFSVLRDTVNSGGAEEIGILIKALGIAASVQITADVCREAGEPVVAGQVELAGKAEILLLSLPLLTRLLSTIHGLLR